METATRPRMTAAGHHLADDRDKTMIPHRDETQALADTPLSIPTPLTRETVPDAAPATALPLAVPGSTSGLGRRTASWACRTARRAGALGLLLLAAWFWALPFFFPVSSRAVINAHTVQVRAPIRGEVATLAAKVGDPIVAGAPVLRVVDRNVDAGPLAVVRGRHAELAARRGRLAAELTDTTTAQASCQVELEKYKEALVDMLGTSCQEGRVRVGVAELEHQVAARRFGRVRGLADSRAVGAFEHDDTRDAATVAKSRIELERSLLERTEKELKAAEQYVFVNRDAPAVQALSRDLAARIPRLKADIAETDSLIQGAERAVREEGERVRQLSVVSVPAPVSGVVWKRPGSLNQVIDRNEAVLDVADQQSVFVEALLHQRHLASVGPGCQATVCLTGGETLQGVVRAVRTPNPAEAEAGCAVSLTDGDPRQVKVVIELTGAADVTLVGRHARVLITAADPGPVERGVVWLFARMRF